MAFPSSCVQLQEMGMDMGALSMGGPDYRSESQGREFMPVHLGGVAWHGMAWQGLACPPQRHPMRWHGMAWHPLAHSFMALPARACCVQRRHV